MAKIYLENKGNRLITIGEVLIKPTFIGEIDDSAVNAKSLKHYLDKGELVKVSKPSKAVLENQGKAPEKSGDNEKENEDQ